MEVYLIFLLIIGLMVAWSIYKAPSDVELWGKDLDESKLPE